MTLPEIANIPIEKKILLNSCSTIKPIKMKKTENSKRDLHHVSSKVYGQKWLLTDSFQIIDKHIPTFKEIDSNAQSIKKRKYSKRQLIKENLPDSEEKVEFQVHGFRIVYHYH